LKRVIGWFIKDPLLKKVLNIQCGDHGLPPSKASFPLHCALMDHYFQGGFYPMGGGAAIVKAMTKAIKKHGGEVRTGQGVKRILVEATGNNKKKRAVGIELQNGEIIKAKRIVSNTDPTNTFKMVGAENLSKKLLARLDKTRYSITSLMFFLTVDMDVRKAGLDSGNIWLMPNRDIDVLYDELKSVDILSTDEFATLFISCSSMKDPTSFNGREHTIEVVTFIDYNSFKSKLPVDDEFTEEYKKFKDKLCDKLVNSLDKVVPGIRNHIVQMQLGTPTTNEFYINSTKGNVYGTEKGFFQTGPFSYTANTEIENLYLCGASIMSHGVAGSSYSGVKTAAKILNCREEDLIKPDGSQHVQVYDAENNTEWPEWLHLKVANKKRRAKPELKLQ
jgi:phytoene dehydrogenase-like protein